METEAVIVTMFAFGVAAGVFVIYLGLRQQSHHNEMRHRERMAMIERGQIPLEHQPGFRAPAARTSRSLSVGIIVIGLGLALGMLIGFAAGASEVAMGVGGAITVIGASFVVRSLVVKPQPIREEVRKPELPE